MIAYLRGKIIFISDPVKKIVSIIIDVNGVGYQVTIPSRELGKYQGNQVTIFTHHHIWDGGQELYGFFNRADLDFFLLLINIQGIGPKSALNVMSHAGMSDIQSAIITNDIETFSESTGLGKKTAEKVILGLKDHLSQMVGGADARGSHEGSLEVIEALMSLGFLREHIQRALTQLPSDITSSEDRIKAALKILGKKK